MASTTRVGSSSPLTAEETSAFTASFHGQVFQPNETGYDESRHIFNGLIDRRPALIARCLGTADVVTAVNFARDHNLTLSIRGGGHNVAGNAMNDGGLVIDLSGMRSVFVDPDRHTVRAQGGCTWADIDRETQLFGLATPGGLVSTTGIAGFSLHGGLGHLRRAFGLALDNILEVEVVTANGEVRVVNETQNADLFWAIRGAGSNFGVVTSFLFRLHRVGPELFLSGTVYALDDGARAMQVWRDFTKTSPDEVSALAMPWNVPDAEPFPPELRRKPVVVLAAVCVGSIDEGMRLTQPLREAATPLMDISHPESYVELQASFDTFFPKGRLYYWKSLYVDDMSNDAIDIIEQCAKTRPSELSDITLWHLGGAINRVAPDATSYRRRDAEYLVTAEASWENSATTNENIQWARDTVAAMKPYSKGGLYLNFAGFGEEKEMLLRDSYGPNYDRLQEIKARYDPTNLFHMNQNIAPASNQIHH